MVQLSSLVLLLILHLSSTQEDPCQPNPCGDNTRCSSTFMNGSPIISCECLIGFKVPDGGDPFDGCYEGEPEVGGVAVPVGGTPDRGQGAPRSLASNKRLEEGVRPAQLIPRTQAKQVDQSYVDVDNVDLFPEECLIHEDCDQESFCSPPPDNKCISACTLPVCGDNALCSAALHRPVCACKDGYEGNPYDKCTKILSCSHDSDNVNMLSITWQNCPPELPL